MRLLIKLIPFFLLIFPFAGLTAEITTKVDRNIIGINESLSVIFQSNEDPDGDPDFSVIEKDFSIRHRSQGSSIQILNGSMSKSTQWKLTLLAKSSGTLTIPAVPFGQDRSPPVIIQVKPESSKTNTQGDSLLFINTSVEPKSNYVQAQILYTVKFYRAVNIGSASLSEPKLSDPNAFIEKLGDDNEYETHLSGRKYIVLERNYAVFPQKAGELSFDPIVFEGQVLVQSRSAFDPFGQNSRLQRASSKSVSVNVQPIPTSMKNKTWLPAKNLKLIEEWPDQEIVVGEPITRTITLMAEGLTSAQIPPFKTVDVNNVKQYPDQPILKNDNRSTGIIGIRQEKIAYIPTVAGSFTLPEMNLNWWNTQTNKMETATIKARTFTAFAAEKPISAAKPPTEETQKINAAQEPMAPTTKISNPYWKWLSFGLMAVWLITLFLWWFSSKGKKTNKQVSESRTLKENECFSALKLALKRNNAEEIKTTLIRVMAAKCPLNPPHNLNDVAKLFDKDLQREILRLNQALYSDKHKDWDSQRLNPYLKIIKAYHPGNGAKVKQETLAPLYPA